jgi:putative flippase GtrA
MFATLKTRATKYGLPARQFSRFAIVGLAVTFFNLAIYHVGVVAGGFDPNVSYTGGFVLCAIMGFFLHGKWSFGDGTRRSRKLVAGARFLVASLVNFLMNNFWVWVMTQHFGLPVWSPYPLVLGVSPLVAFSLNRLWVFK